MNFVIKEPINKGWSGDKKYCVTDENGTRYLLRISDIAQRDIKQSEFNMMIDRNGQLHIIDFNRNDYGDPWEEFNRIVWCAQKSPLFASGMVNGYFEDDVPMDFWRLLAPYISSNTLSSVYWAIPFGQDEVNTMLSQAKEVLTWYDNMKIPVPTWYSKDIAPFPYIQILLDT